jgi:hypothetical protein
LGGSCVLGAGRGGERMPRRAAARRRELDHWAMMRARAHTDGICGSHSELHAATK